MSKLRVMQGERSQSGASLVGVLVALLVMGALAAFVVVQLDLLGRQTDEVTAGTTRDGIAGVPTETARTSCAASVQAVTQAVDRHMTLYGVAPTVEELQGYIAGSDPVFGATPDPGRRFAIDYTVGTDGRPVVVGRYLSGTDVATC